MTIAQCTQKLEQHATNSKLGKRQLAMVETSQVLLALQVAFFFASIALVLRRTPAAPLPPPVEPPASAGSDQNDKKKKGKVKRQVGWTWLDRPFVWHQVANMIKHGFLTSLWLKCSLGDGGQIPGGISQTLEKVGKTWTISAAKIQKIKSQVVELRPEDRLAPAKPMLTALRPTADARLDMSHLVRVSGNLAGHGLNCLMCLGKLWCSWEDCDVSGKIVMFLGKLWCSTMWTTNCSKIEAKHEKSHGHLALLMRDFMSCQGPSASPDAAALLILPGGNYDYCNLRCASA